MESVGKIAHIVINSSGNSSCLQRIFVISEIAFLKSTPSDPYMFEPKIFLQSSPSEHDGPAAPFVFKTHILLSSEVLWIHTISDEPSKSDLVTADHRISVVLQDV